MLFECANDSHCLRMQLKPESNGLTDGSRKMKTAIYSTATNGISISVAVLFIILSLLVTIGLYIWIKNYKLKYLVRITFLLFIFAVIAPSIPSYFIGWQESPMISLFSQKSLWSNVSTVSGTICLLMIFIRYHWAMPINIVKDSSSVGFSHLKHTAKSRRRTIREISGDMLRYACREPSQLNPVYINGWIPLVEGREILPGKVVSIVAVGYKFCVYRGEDGKIFVVDAYCPHLGADLSAGGKVIGNCIECPFHGWQFCGETGKCTKIPYSTKVPEIAKVKVWESCEKNGYVFVWHHADNEPPSWELPSISEIENGEWVYRGRSELTVHCHIQEIPENGADIAHLSQVHSRFVFSGPHLENAGPEGHWLQHDWKPQWSPDENNPHIARVKIVQRLLFCGFEIPFTRVNVDIQQIGPATVHLHMESDFGKGVLLQYITSEGPLLQRVVHLFYTEPRFKQSPANFLIWGEAVMVQRDIAVWNNKKFLKNPLLVKEDRLILKFRRWYSQFYSEHSPSLKDLRERTLEW